MIKLSVMRHLLLRPNVILGSIRTRHVECNQAPSSSNGILQKNDQALKCIQDDS